MSSRTPTPSGLPPTDRSQYRFHQLMTPTEWVEDYRPGKFHPVHFGNTFAGTRYKIIRKLGYGSFSTVWLASDQVSKNYVAIKILCANADVSQNEAGILETLSRSPTQHPGAGHVMVLKDSFEHEGPNGMHRCLVFDAMGPSTASMIEDLPQSLTQDSELPRYPLWMAKSIIRQLLLGIDYLHQSNIAHGDIQPGNILFPLKDLASVDEVDLRQTEDVETEEEPGSISEPVRRLDGKIDLWAPRYLAMSQSLTNYVDLSPNFKVKLSDLGGAFYISDPPSKTVTPVGLRSPELICGNKISQDQDVWSFGCLMFEFITGVPLFTACAFGRSKENNDDDHILQMCDILGPLPSYLMCQWSRSHIYFKPNGEKITNHIGELPEGRDAGDVENSPSLEVFFDQYKPVDRGVEEADTIKALLRQILRYDPKERPSASQLLKNPWFADPGL